MTDEELKAIEAKCAHNADEPYMEGCHDMTGACRALMAEIGRLKGLIKDAEILGGEWPGACPWCGASASEGHATNCPAFNPDGTVK